MIERRLIRTKGSDNPVLDLILILILAMRLLKDGNFWSNRRFDKLLLSWKEKSPHFYGITNYDNPFLNSYSYSLSREETTDLKKIYNLVKDFKTRSTQGDKSVLSAIEWFNKYFYEFNIEHRFIFLMLLMETLCSDRGGEIQYKLSNRISLIIGENDEDMLSIIRGFKDLYKERSNIIHGSTSQIEEKCIMKAEDYSRRLLNKFLLFSSNGYTKNQALDLVNKALVSKSDREKLDEIVKT